jgi:integrase
VSSNANLPLDPLLAELLEKWRLECKSERESDSDPELEWIFANPATGMPYYSPGLQQKWIRPAAESLGIKGLGFHALRHSYRSWLDATGATPGVTKDLMRHSAIGQSFEYGRAMSEDKRLANTKVVKALLGAPKKKKRRK